MNSSANLQSQVEALFNEYRRPLGRYARTMLEAAYVDDVVSETFVLALTKWREVPENPVGWLFTTVQFLCRNQQRKSKRTATIELELAADESAFQHDWDSDVVSNEEILSALAKLSETDRALLILSGIDGLRAEDIAIMHNISINAVYVRIHRARGRFKALLDSNKYESIQIEVPTWKS